MVVEGFKSILCRPTLPDPAFSGTASVLGGGKFANGAQTAAIQYLFNQASTPKDEMNNMVERTVNGKKVLISRDKASDILLYGEDKASVMSCQMVNDCIDAFEQKLTVSPDRGIINKAGKIIPPSPVKEGGKLLLEYSVERARIVNVCQAMNSDACNGKGKAWLP